MDKQANPVFLSLDKKLLGVVLAVNVLFTLGWTAFTLYSEERSERRSQATELSGIEKEILPVVANSVWDLDRPMTRVQLKQLLAYPFIVRVQVNDGGLLSQPAFDMRKKGSFQHTEDRRYDLLAPASAGGKKFGSIVLTKTDDNIFSILRDQAFKIFTSEALETLILSLLILYAFRVLVLHRLSHLSRYFRRNPVINRNTPTFQPNLSGKIPDEFDLLAESINRVVEESKVHQSEIENLKTHAEKANEAKSMFLASVNHELRTPLNAILGVADLLPSSLGNQSEVQQLIEIQRRSGEHLLHLVDEILDFSKIEAGEVKFELAPLDMRNSVETIRTIVEGSVDERGNHLVLHVDKDFPKLILADAYRINQVVINLVSNANKFTDHGEIQVAVRPLGRDMLISVKDNGIGIPPDKITEIFLPFRQLEGSGQQLRKGTGIGLSISKRLVELMGGRIEVESAPGEGSDFRVLLPLVTAEMPDVKPLARAEIPQAGKIKLLVVEDTPEVQTLIRAFLKGTSIQPSFAENGEEGLRDFLKDQYNLVLMDLQMPIMDGFQATQKIREIERKDGKHVPILALTALTTKRDLDRALQSGCDGYVTKPFSRNQLLQTLQKYAAS